MPVYDDAKLFEMLILENFQAGLSWECVLNKWEAFRRAFDGFDLEKVCAYDDAKINALQNDPGIIRNRLKYALTNHEVKMICMQRLVKVDSKVRTDSTFPAGFMGSFGEWSVRGRCDHP